MITNRLRSARVSDAEAFAFLGSLAAPQKTSHNTEQIRASMDLSRTTSENRRHWKDADALSGRAAYFKGERKTARERSRLEAQNNSWYAGMLRTAANHIVGTGPRLQVQTADPELNARIERAWRKWSRAIQFTEKLKIIVEAYWRDGEVFGMRAMRPSLSPITLDVRLYECDQVSQPYWHILDPTLEDGKRIDNLGNAVEYWIYDHHPGDLNIGHVNLMAGDWYPADQVFHVFRADRPGQLRGIPRCAPAIDWLAHMRRFSKATLSAAERAALWGVFVKTTGSAMLPAAVPDFTSVDWEREMLNFLPDGWEPTQIRSDHPATTNEMFQRTELMYFCRCSNMPYSLACGTSKDANFSAAKMDIKNLWEPEVLSEQDKLGITVCDTVFRWFLEDCVIEGGDILDGAPALDEIEHKFFWPPLPQSDETDVAAAAKERMSSGQSTLPMEYARSNEDFERAMQMGAQAFGVTVAEYKSRVLDAIFPAPKGAAPPPERERAQVEHAEAAV